MNEVKILIDELLWQRNNDYKGNVYHYSQVVFAYNSNKIEGSRLTENQTEQIFTDNTILIDKADTIIRMDDAIEAANHFRLFKFMLDTLDDPIDKDYLIKMNTILKQGTTYADDPRYNVGGFKLVPNVIGGINPVKTTAPKDVEKEIDSLIKEFDRDLDFDDIVDFHVKFEKIHPFGDGNGCVGRMIMFKQCLENDVFPFIVLDDDRPYYIRGLKMWNEEKGYLRDTLLHEQDIYKAKCKEYGVFRDLGREM